jgi:hypothetical protein
MSISFFHIASVYPKATDVIIENVRKHHPNDYYFLAVDGLRMNYFLTSDKYFCDTIIYGQKIGGPVSPYGFTLEKTIEFFERFRRACRGANTSHIIMMEDDVLITKPITVNPEWEHVGADTRIGNHLPDFLLDMIEIHSGKRPIRTQYGAGGGSIFKVSTFLEHYERNIQWFKNNFNIIQTMYPTIGYVDCFMNVYYWLAGKDYSANPHRTDTHNHQPGFDYEAFISNQPSEIEIINNYKKYYYE